MASWSKRRSLRSGFSSGVAARGAAGALPCLARSAASRSFAERPLDALGEPAASMQRGTSTASKVRRASSGFASRPEAKRKKSVGKSGVRNRESFEFTPRA